MSDRLIFKNDDAFILRDGLELSLLEVQTLNDPEFEREVIKELASFFNFPFAPNSSVTARQRPPKWLGEPPVSRKLTFYPGTFNPWHEGHLNCLKLCPEENVVVVPDYSPWKSAGVAKTPWERVRELALTLRKCSRPGLSLYPGFTILEAPHATADWLSQLEDHELNLIIGMDNFIALERWNRVRDLLALLNKLYVVPRSFDQMSDQALLRAKNFIAALESAPQVIYLPEHSAMDASSTNLR